MPAEVLRQTLIRVVVNLAHHVGFEQASTEAVDILVDVLYNYLKTISGSIANYAGKICA